MYAFKIGHPVHWLTQKLWPSWESANSDKFFLPSGTPFYTFCWNSSICHRWQNSAIGDSCQQGQLSLLVAKSVPVGDKIITLIIYKTLMTEIEWYIRNYFITDRGDNYIHPLIPSHKHPVLDIHDHLGQVLQHALPKKGSERSLLIFS